MNAFAGTGAFLGHIGGDDFVAIVDLDTAEHTAIDLIQSVGRRRSRPSTTQDDVERGYIEVVDRQGSLHRFPITSVSIGIATNSNRPIGSHWEASEIATEMKQFAKREPKSSYAIDRRRLGEEDEEDVNGSTSSSSGVAI